MLVFRHVPIKHQTCAHNAKRWAWEHQVIADGTVGMLARYSFQGSQKQAEPASTDADQLQWEDVVI